MITHCIIMSSSYSLGTRIALDYIMNTDEIQKKLEDDSKKIIQICGKDVSMSTHLIQAEDNTWEAVCNADHFFKGIEVLPNVDNFIELIQKDRKLQGIDVAKYILSKFSCTQLKLQKLVYLCYADYLCNTRKGLFTDKIFAYKYGPVVDTVYSNYKKYGYKPIEKERKNIDNNGVLEMPAKSRILFAEDGLEKIQSIEETLKKYGLLTANELVDVTHSKDTPWDKTPKKNWPLKVQIEDEIIKKYHKNEFIESVDYFINKK